MTADLVDTARFVHNLTKDWPFYDVGHVPFLDESGGIGRGHK
jgi:hypothetical protein